MNHAEFIWSVADILRGPYRQSEYGKVVLPFTVLRRLDCVLAATKGKVTALAATLAKDDVQRDSKLKKAAGQSFYNVSPFDLAKVRNDPDNAAANLVAYVSAFSANTKDIFDKFEFQKQVELLAKRGLLYPVLEKFASIDLHPDAVPNDEMGKVFENLIRRFADASNETAGEHFTPREVVKLIVDLILIEDDEVLTKPGVVRRVYDPTSGTGGMLSTTDDSIMAMNPKAKISLFGQELNDESYAICKADMLIKGQNVENMVAGNTLTDDGHADERFDYMLSNPPFGVDWKTSEKVVRAEHEKQGFKGRFGPGLPRVSDGSMLFLMHLLSKMQRSEDGGCRFGIVLNGSPLFSGGAGSGESEIRKYVLENDLLEAIVGLPTDMFYNTGIATYVWIVSNKKPAERKGKVQLIDASSLWAKMKKSLGSKRKEMSADDIAMVVKLFGKFAEASMATVFDKDGAEVSKTVVLKGEKGPKAPVGGKVKSAPLSIILPNEEFGYRTITVERPMRDAKGKVVLAVKGKLKGQPQPDAELRDTENVPLAQDVHAYLDKEVLPFASDAWIDEEKTKVGYEIPFSRHFYVFEPPRPLTEIDADLKAVTGRISAMIEGLSA